MKTVTARNPRRIKSKTLSLVRRGVSLSLWEGEGGRSVVVVVVFFLGAAETAAAAAQQDEACQAAQAARRYRPEKQVAAPGLCACRTHLHCLVGGQAAVGAGTVRCTITH